MAFDVITTLRMVVAMGGLMEGIVQVDDDAEVILKR